MEGTKDLMEGRHILLSAIIEHEIKSVTERVPETGRFSPVFWQMAYYGTAHKGRLYTEYSEAHGCAVRASMIPNGTDAEISNYLFFGKKQACLDWLAESSRVEELIGIYDKLAKRADTYGD